MRTCKIYVQLAKEIFFISRLDSKVNLKSGIRRESRQNLIEVQLATAAVDVVGTSCCVRCCFSSVWCPPPEIQVRIQGNLWYEAWGNFAENIQPNKTHICTGTCLVWCEMCEFSQNFWVFQPHKIRISTFYAAAALLSKNFLVSRWECVSKTWTHEILEASVFPHFTLLNSCNGAEKICTFQEIKNWTTAQGRTSDFRSGPPEQNLDPQSRPPAKQSGSTPLFLLCPGA